MLIGSNLSKYYQIDNKYKKSVLNDKYYKELSSIKRNSLNLFNLELELSLTNDSSLRYSKHRYRCTKHLIESNQINNKLVLKDKVSRYMNLQLLLQGGL